MNGNLTVVALAAITWILRATQGAEEAVAPWGVTLSVGVALILLYTGWKGWEMVYRYHVAVQDKAEDVPQRTIVREKQRIER